MSMTVLPTLIVVPGEEIDRRYVHDLWCQALQLPSYTEIPVDCSFYSMGGHSLPMLQLYQQYQKTFNLNSHILGIASFFQHATIEDHVQLLNEHCRIGKDQQLWKPLNLSQAEASWAQERIYHYGVVHDETVDNVPIVLQLVQGSVSIARLRRALDALVWKHAVLRTSLHLDIMTDTLTQRIEPFSYENHYTMTVSHAASDYEFDTLLNESVTNETLFNLDRGHVLHCRIIQRAFVNDDTMSAGDTIIFNFHCLAFDNASIDLFLGDLCLCYQNHLSPLDKNALQYIDYAIHERQLDMQSSQTFWHQFFDGYDFERLLSLPVDRFYHRIEGKIQRAPPVTSVHSVFDENLSRSFVAYASSHNVTFFQLGLACFYAFIFKLSNSERDLCVACSHENRYRSELSNIIGVFAATLPYRLQVDPYASFEQLLNKVHHRCLAILEHSHVPLQHIVAGHPVPQSSAAFMGMLFNVFITKNNTISIDLDDTTQLKQMSTSSLSTATVFDFALELAYDKKKNEFTCTIKCLRDLFNSLTMSLLVDRFCVLLRQLFNVDQSTINRTPTQSIYNFSLLLPDELRLMTALNKTAYDSSFDCIHHVFLHSFEMHPQKVAIELDEQSATYSELLCLVQRLAFHLIDTRHVQPGEIICQCVERSIEMVVGLMAIKMAGAVYCPLPAHDPPARRLKLVKETGSGLVLVHFRTKDKCEGITTTLNIDTINLIEIGDVHRLSSVEVTRDSIAYISFTSGSTGVPKAVS
ncbi:hypothetical protein I4U23_021839 [Adineta vaga]|nr:hypothetical protein I4U23_021839 [Adineta vaga]